MTRTRTSDLEAVLALLRRCGDLDDLAAFRAVVAAEVAALIPVDSAGFEADDDPAGLTLTLSQEPEQTVRLILRRSGRRFSARERRLAQLLAPHFATAYRRVADDTRRQGLLRALERAAGDTAPAELRALGLTPREAEVLAAVGHGSTNEQIAFELGISAPTVKKHLEHIYAKLRVSGRVAALARVRQPAAVP